MWPGLTMMLLPTRYTFVTICWHAFSLTPQPPALWFLEFSVLTSPRVSVLGILVPGLCLKLHLVRTNSSSQLSAFILFYSLTPFILGGTKMGQDVHQGFFSGIFLIVTLCMSQLSQGVPQFPLVPTVKPGTQSTSLYDLSPSFW